MSRLQRAIDSFDRRPSPAPVDTDTRRPMAIGLLAWTVALIVSAILALTGGVGAEVLVACVTGVLFGIAGLIYLQVRRRRAARRIAAPHPSDDGR